MQIKKKAISEWWNSRPISTIIVVSFGILFAVILLLSTFIFTLSIRHTLINSALKSNQKLVDQAIGNMDAITDLITAVSFYISGEAELRHLLKHFPESPVEQIVAKNTIKTYLTQLWMNRPEIVGITIYLDAIEDVNSSTIGLSSTAFLDEHGFTDRLGNNKGIIIHSASPIVRGSIIFNSLSLVKIYDENNQTIGILSFEISPKNIYNQCLKPSQASANSILFGIDENSKILLHSDFSKLGLDFTTIYPNLEDGNSLSSGLIKYEQRKYLQVISRYSKLKCRVIELIPLEDVIDFRPFVLNYTLLTFLYILISSLLTYFLATKITQPIIHLSKIMSDESPLDATLPQKFLGRQNEIGTLYRNYKILTEHVTELILKLQGSMEDQKRLEVDALRAQINPHFMYNCFDFINWKAQDANVPEIANMLTNLSRFMRISLAESNLVCPLEFEVEHVRTYLEIFHVRYKGSFTYDISVDPSLLGILVPQFILQPLVENSIIHGFGRGFTDGLIRLSISRRDDWLCFDVEDNGKGMSREDFESIINSNEKSSRSGLKSINDRIRYVVSRDSYSGLQIIDSSAGLHIHFEILIAEEL